MLEGFAEYLVKFERYRDRPETFAKSLLSGSLEFGPYKGVGRNHTLPANLVHDFVISCLHELDRIGLVLTPKLKAEILLADAEDVSVGEVMFGITPKDVDDFVDRMVAFAQVLDIGPEEYTRIFTERGQYAFNFGETWWLQFEVFARINRQMGSTLIHHAPTFKQYEAFWRMAGEYPSTHFIDGGFSHLPSVLVLAMLFVPEVAYQPDFSGKKLQVNRLRREWLVRAYIHELTAKKVDVKTVQQVMGGLPDRAVFRRKHVVEVLKELGRISPLGEYLESLTVKLSEE